MKQRSLFSGGGMVAPPGTQYVERPGEPPKLLPPGASPPVPDDTPSAEVARYVSFTADLVRPR